MSRVICNCCRCENPIYEGDSVYEIDNVMYHQECIEDISTTDLIGLLGLAAFEAYDDSDDIKAEYDEDFRRYYEK